MAWDNWKWQNLNGGWTQQGANLPTRRNVEKNRSVERVMIDAVGGQEDIRARRSPDGVKLRTRDGFPVFEAVVTPGEEEDVFRWFSVRTGSRHALLDPHELTIKQVSASPGRYGYTVAGIATSTPLPAKYARWNDVWLLAGNELYINYRQHPSFTTPIPRPPGDSDSAPRLPWVHAPSLRGTIIGNTLYASVNPGAAIKPVFAIGRVSVAQMQVETDPDAPGYVPPAILGGGHARGGGQARLCGPRVMVADDAVTAHLAQLEFTGSWWDDPGGSWMQRGCAVSIPNITEKQSAVSLEFGTPGCPFVGSSTAKTVDDYCVVGDVEVGYVSPGVYSTTSLPDVFRVAWIPTEPWLLPITVEEVNNFATSLYRGEVSLDVSLCGAQCTIDVVNETENVSSVNTYRVKETHISTGAPESYVIRGGPYRYAPELENAADPPSVVGDRGVRPAGTLTSASVKETIHRGTTNVACAGKQIVSCVFERRIASGERATFYARTGAADAAIASGQAFTGGAFTAWGRDERLIAAVSNYAQRVADSTHYRAFSTVSGYMRLHIGSTKSTFAEDDSHIDWRTVDYILFDEANETYVYVESEFTATGGADTPSSAKLTVNVVVSTPSGTTKERAFSGVVPVSAVLPYKVDPSLFVLESGRDYIPTHALRPFFAPLAFCQGMFPGAAYVEAVEVGEGAAPAELFDFTVRLVFDDFMDSPEEPRANFSFAPRNLIELLYAYVFSHAEYGLGLLRYPVEAVRGHELLSEKLFNKPIRIQRRNGDEVAWGSTLPAPHATSSSKTLGRT